MLAFSIHLGQKIPDVSEQKTNAEVLSTATLLLGDFNEHAWWIMGKYRKNVYEYVKKKTGKKIYKKKINSPLKSREGN